MKTILLFLAVFFFYAAAHALEPSSVDAVHQTWSGTPQGNGKTVYSDGFNTTIEVSPSSRSFNAWTDGKNTVGSIYAPRSDQSLPPPAFPPPTTPDRSPYSLVPPRP